MTRLLLISLFSIAFYLWAPAAQADDFDAAIAAFDAEDYKTAFELFKPLAEAGNDDAQYYVGAMYQYGGGVSQSDEQAFYWFEQSAENGDDEAQYGLGLMYADGEGVKQSDKKARHWFERSAAQGHDGAQYELGEALRTKSPKKALPWLLKAAAQNNSDAYVSLGHMHSFGKGVAENETKAFEYYQKAADLGNTYGLYWTANSLINGDGVQKDRLKAGDILIALQRELTKDDGPIYHFVNDDLSALRRDAFYKMDLKERKLNEAVAQQDEDRNKAKSALLKARAAQKDNNLTLAAEYLRVAAHLDNAEAARELGYAFEMGLGVNKSHADALKWYQKADQGNDTEAMFLLGRLFLQTTDDITTYTQASIYLKKAADRGFEDAKRQIEEYESGRDRLIGIDVAGLKISPKIRTNEAAANERARQAAIAYAEEMKPENGYRLFGAGDYASALPIIQYNARNNHADSMNLLGMMYEKGWGVKPNYQEAKQYYRKAMQQGSYGAKFNFGYLLMRSPDNRASQIYGYEIMTELANNGLSEAKTIVNEVEEAKRLQNIADYQAFRKATSSFGKQCRNPRRILVSRNNGPYREETVCN